MPCLNSDLYFIFKIFSAALLETVVSTNLLQVSPRKQDNPPFSASRHINNSLNVYLFHDFELQPGKSKEFNNNKMKVQVKRAFRSYFVCNLKSNKKADRLCMKLSSTSNTGVQRCLYPLFPNQRYHFLLPPYFQTSGQYQENDQRTYCRLPSSSELSSRTHPLKVLWTPQGFISRKYFLNFFSNLYIPSWLQKIFKFLVLRLLANTCTQAKLSPGPYHYSQGRKKLLIPPEHCFLKIYFSPKESGGRIMELKE